MGLSGVSRIILNLSAAQEVLIHVIRLKFYGRFQKEVGISIVDDAERVCYNKRLEKAPYGRKSKLKKNSGGAQFWKNQ